MVLGEKHGTNYLPCTSFSSPCFVYNFFRNVYFFFMGSDPINSPSRYKKSWFFNVHIYSVKSAQSLLKCGDFWYPVLMFEDLRFPKSGQQPHEAQIIHHVFYNFFRTVYYFFMGSDPSTRQWFICFIFCIESRCTLNNAIVFIFEVSSYRGNTLNTPFCARILSLW